METRAGIVKIGATIGAVTEGLQEASFGELRGGLGWVTVGTIVTGEERNETGDLDGSELGGT